MLFSLTFTGFLLVACFIDLREFRIPNAVPLAMMALFLIKAAAVAGVVVWPDHIAAFSFALTLGFLAFAFGLIGGGDAKLMTAVALWLGMGALPVFLAITAVGGGVLALVLIGLRYLAARRPLATATAGSSGGPRLLEKNAPVPYALPIAMAALWLEWR